MKENADTLSEIDALWLTLHSYFASTIAFDARLIRFSLYGPPSRPILYISDQPVPELPAVHNELESVHVVLLSKDQASADIVRAKLKYLSKEITIFVNCFWI